MEHFETSSSERNIERDKRLFIEAVRSAHISEMPTSFDDVAVEKLHERLKQTPLFVLGETHGVEENASILYTLFKKFGFRQLALEWEPCLQKHVENFLVSGDIIPKALNEIQSDGRVTPGHFALIKQLKSEGVLENIIYFRRLPRGLREMIEFWKQTLSNVTDAVMARSVLKDFSHIPTLVSAGNYHARTEPELSDEDPGMHHPMGEYIKKAFPNTSYGNIKYRAGTFTNFGTHPFVSDPSDTTIQNNSRFYQNEAGLYIFDLPLAHPAVVPNPHER